MKKISLCCAFLIIIFSACNKKASDSAVETKPTPYRFETLKAKESSFQIFALLSRNPENSTFFPASFKSSISAIYPVLLNEKKSKLTESLGEPTPEFSSEHYSVKNSWWLNQSKNNKSFLEEINSWLIKNSCDEKTKTLTAEQIKKWKNFGITKLCFDFEWENPFNAKDTILAHFQSSPHASSTVSMMMKKSLYRYFEDEKSQWLELTAKKSPLVLLIALPKNKFKIQDTSLELNSNYLQKIEAGLRKEKVEVVLPKFNLKENISYKEILSLIGNDYIFERKYYAKNSNFSKNKIDELIQLYDFRLDEAGINHSKSETNLESKNEGLHIGFTKKFYADQPFLVVLKDQKTSEILLISQVINIK